MPIHRWIKKQNIVYLLSGILCGHKKQWHPDTWILWHSSWHIHPHNMYEFRKHSAKWKKPVPNSPHISVQFNSVQSLSRVWLFVTLWTIARQVSLSITNSWSLLKFTSIDSVTTSNHLILCRPLLLLPSVFPSIRVFSNESALPIRWPKDWSFSFNISPSNEHSGLIFRMDWLHLLAVQGTLKSFFQHHSSKASILQCSAFFIVPTLTPIHDYWKNHSLD